MLGQRIAIHAGKRYQVAREALRRAGVTSDERVLFERLVGVLERLEAKLATPRAPAAPPKPMPISPERKAEIAKHVRRKLTRAGAVRR